MNTSPTWTIDGTYYTVDEDGWYVPQSFHRAYLSSLQMLSTLALVREVSTRKVSLTLTKNYRDQGGRLYSKTYSLQIHGK